MESLNTTGDKLDITSKILRTIYPIGAIYITTNATNPSELFGGTWEPYAEGRTLIGNGSLENVNFVAGSTGGNLTHTLTLEEMPSHTHTQSSHSHIGHKQSFNFWFNQFQHASKNQPNNTFENNGCFNNSENQNVELIQENWKNDTSFVCESYLNLICLHSKINEIFLLIMNFYFISVKSL